MEKRQVRCSCYLMITALIWGAAFVAQSKGGDAIGPYSFSCLRYFLAGLMMLPLRSLFNRWGITDCMPPTRKNQRNLWIGDADRDPANIIQIYSSCVIHIFPTFAIIFNIF